jgi:hypothetical protein
MITENRKNAQAHNTMVLLIVKQPTGVTTQELQFSG